MNTDGFNQWAIVELMGHNVMAGQVSEQVVAGAAFVRVDVPAVGEGERAMPGFTKLFAPQAIYGITPTTEDHARQAAESMRVRPVALYILPERVTSRPALEDRRRYGGTEDFPYAEDADGDDDGSPF